MKRILILIISLVVMVSCRHKRGSGNIISQTKTTGAFTGISVGGPFEVEIKNGAAQNVVVEADDNLMRYVDVRVINDELKINLENISVSKSHLKIYVTAPSINKIKTSAAAEVVGKDQLTSSGKIMLSASSASSIKVQVDAPKISTEASSGADIDVSGRTKDLNAEGSSGGDINAFDLLSENSTASASSGSSVHVNASISVDASASSGGKVAYKGAASNVKKSESSGGNVDKE
jgi:hypothetical protein